MKIQDSIAMEALGERLAGAAAGGELITLTGDLGTGKTTLVRGFVRACGHGGPVKSPTFTLVEPYYLARFAIFHFDFYRLNDPEEGEFLGLRDYFDGRSVCLAEWPEKAGDLLPSADIALAFSYCDPGRGLSIQYLTAAGERLMGRAENNIEL